MVVATAVPQEHSNLGNLKDLAVLVALVVVVLVGLLPQDFAVDFMAIGALEEAMEVEVALITIEVGLTFKDIISITDGNIRKIAQHSKIQLLLAHVVLRKERMDLF